MSGVVRTLTDNAGMSRRKTSAYMYIVLICRCILNFGWTKKNWLERDLNLRPPDCIYLLSLFFQWRFDEWWHDLWENRQGLITKIVHQDHPSQKKRNLRVGQHVNSLSCAPFDTKFEDDQLYCLVQYIGWPSKFDEWCSSWQIKPRAPSRHWQSPTTPSPTSLRKIKERKQKTVFPSKK